MQSEILLDAQSPQAVPVSTLKSIAQHEGISGISLAQQWKSVETAPGVYNFETARVVCDLAASIGKQFSWRIRGGQATPTFHVGRTWVPQGTTQYDIARGKTIPCPFLEDGTLNKTWLRAYRALLSKVSAWALGRPLDKFHGSWFGGLSAEIYYTDEMKGLKGYSDAAVKNGHLAILNAVQNMPASIGIEMPIGGMGGPLFVALQKVLVDDMKANTRTQFIQINWLDDRAGNSDPLCNWRFGDWPRHGLQMIHAEEYDWDRVFERAKMNGGEYTEFFLKQFSYPSAPDLYRNIAEAATW